MPRPGEEIRNVRTGQLMRFETVDPSLLRIFCVSPFSQHREPPHIHPRQINRFVVQEGALHFMVGEELRVLGPGHEIEIPPGVEHHFWNESAEDAVYLQDFQPALNIAEFFEMYFYLASAGKLGENGRPGLLQTLVLTEAYWDEIRVTGPPPLLQRILCFLFAPVARALGYTATRPA